VAGRRLREACEPCAGSTNRARSPLLLFCAVAAVTVILDQTTKGIALAHLQSGPIPLLGGVIRLTLTRNTGSAFGLPAPAWVTTAVSVIVSVVILAWVALRRAQRRPVTGPQRRPERSRGAARGAGAPVRRMVALALVLGGAAGNLIDRLCAGAVVDFIDLRIWPVFNVADIALTIGIGLLMLEAIRRR
jgi:signal peptidase II